MRLKNSYCLNNHFSFNHDGHSIYKDLLSPFTFKVVSERVNTGFEFQGNYWGP